MPFIFTAITSLFGFLGTGIKSIFGFKGEQAHTVQSALEVLKSVNDVDGQQVTASAQALSAILTQGSFLEKNWRPIFMFELMIIVSAFFFGYSPPHLNDPMSPTMLQIWELLKIGLMGYLPLRTIEKVMQSINIASILKELIKKKVL